MDPEVRHAAFSCDFDPTPKEGQGISNNFSPHDVPSKWHQRHLDIYLPYPMPILTGPRGRTNTASKPCRY